MDTIFEDEQEYIVIDGAKMPIYQIDPDYKSPHLIACANCNFSAMTEEEKGELAASIERVVEMVKNDKKDRV